MKELDLGNIGLILDTDLSTMAKRRKDLGRVIDREAYDKAVSYIHEVFETVKSENLVFRSRVGQNFLEDILIPDNIKGLIGLGSRHSQIAGHFDRSQPKLAKLTLRNLESHGGLTILMSTDHGLPFSYSFITVPNEDSLSISSSSSEAGILAAVILSKFANDLVENDKAVQAAPIQ